MTDIEIRFRDDLRSATADLNIPLSHPQIAAGIARRRAHLIVRRVVAGLAVALAFLLAWVSNPDWFSAPAPGLPDPLATPHPGVVATATLTLPHPDGDRPPVEVAVHRNADGTVAFTGPDGSASVTTPADEAVAWARLGESMVVGVLPSDSTWVKAVPVADPTNAVSWAATTDVAELSPSTHSFAIRFDDPRASQSLAHLIHGPTAGSAFDDTGRRIASVAFQRGTADPVTVYYDSHLDILGIVSRAPVADRLRRPADLPVWTAQGTASDSTVIVAVALPASASANRVHVTFDPPLMMLADIAVDPAPPVDGVRLAHGMWTGNTAEATRNPAMISWTDASGAPVTKRLW